MSFRALIFSAVLLALGTNANAALFGIGGDSWKEEVQLHDGQKIIVERSQTYGGEREIGQSPPVKEHIIRFVPPGSSQIISWTSEYDKDLGRTNFNLLAVHVLNGVPYVIASPNLCLSYNKWGRPNPPYVIFRYDGNWWQRISLEQFPPELKTVNVAFGVRGRDVEELVSIRLASAEKISELNRDVSQTEFKTILREPIANAEGSCVEMIHYKCGWISPHGTFGRDLMDKSCK